MKSTAHMDNQHPHGNRDMGSYAVLAMAAVGAPVLANGAVSSPVGAFIAGTIASVACCWGFVYAIHSTDKGGFNASFKDGSAHICFAVLSAIANGIGTAAHGPIQDVARPVIDALRPAFGG